MKKHSSPIPFHPFLLGVFPVFSLYAYNLGEVVFQDVLRSAAAGLLLAALLYGGVCFLSRRVQNAALAASWLLLLLFTFGPLKELLYRHPIANTVNLGWNRYFVPAWCIACLGGAWFFLRKLQDARHLTRLATIISVAMFVLPLYSIFGYNLNMLQKRSAGVETTSISQPDEVPVAGRPDIYYIILDMYGRDDILRSEFQYDNTEFLRALEEAGFYIARCSTANYVHTLLSIQSSLNMDYVDEYLKRIPSPDTEYPAAKTAMANFIRDSAVMEYVSRQGYSFVTFENEYPFLNIPDSDHYLQMRVKRNWNYISPFEQMVLQRTPFSLIAGRFNFSQPANNSANRSSFDLRKYGYQYDRTLFVLEQLEEMPARIPGPKFVYAHLLVPHKPFVFGADGAYVGDNPNYDGGPNDRPVDQASYREAYTNQVTFINSRILPLVKSIMKNSERPPVIILQGDHGPWGGGEIRLPILNAYYLPDAELKEELYTSITPVNTFRLVFNAYLGGQFRLLEDRRYVSDEGKIFDLLPFTDSWASCPVP